MKKNIFKSITFLLILLVILIVLSRIFVPKNNTKEAGLESKYVLASGVYLEPENTIDVLVVGLYKLMNSREDFLGPVNIGNPEEISILDLAQKIIQKTNSLMIILDLV